MDPSWQYDGTRVEEHWNDVFKALAADPRRRLIVALNDRPADEYVELPEAAMSTTIETNERVLCQQLNHRHLPLLADHDYIRWERDPLRAWRGPRFDEVSVVLETLHRKVDRIPDRLVHACDRLEYERETRNDD